MHKIKFYQQDTKITPMKVKTISYTKTFQVYQFVNDKISIEDTFPSTVSDEECFRQLMERVDALGKIAYPHLYEEKERGITMTTYQPTITITDKREEVTREIVPIEEQIPKITDPKVLESFRLFVKGKPHLQELFDNKLKELNNNQK